jgi:2-aminoadipate transaminase
VVEDDWAGDLRLEGDDVPTIHALDGGRGVIHLGSFSKNLMPGLRVGWVAAPPEVARRIEALKQITDCGTSPMLQMALWRFLDGGHLEPHLVRVRAGYRARRDAMLSGLARRFPSEVAWSRPHGGLFVWVTMPDVVDGDELFVAAGREGVSFSCGSLFHLEGRGRNTMRLAYASVGPDRIDDGLAILGGLIAERLAEPERRPAGGLERTLPVL